MFKEFFSRKKKISVNIIHPEGARVEVWVLGQDIDVNTYKKFMDPVTQELYVLVHFESGAPVTSVLKKEIYEMAKARVGEALNEDDLASVTNRLMDDLGWASSEEKESQ